MNISLNNHVKQALELNRNFNVIENILETKNNSTIVNLEPKQTLLNKETIIQLQEIQDYSILQISLKKEDVNFNGTPSLEWLKGRDDKLYNEKLYTLSNGYFFMREFSEIVERNENSKTISHKDWNSIVSSIEGFENGFKLNKERKTETNDPIIHRVLDYIAPKTLQRIEILKQYLSTKIKEPEIPFELKDVDVKQTVDIDTTNDKSYEKTDDLLNFLVKDLEWYKWFLEDKKQPFISYSLQYLQLTRSITHILTINEVYQSA